MKHATLRDFLTEAQIEQCIAIYERSAERGDPERDFRGLAISICEEVIKPNLVAINEKLGQENDPRYLAYMVEYALLAASRNASLS
jgi:hypothetical protein